jgi:transposase-like protein
LQSLVFRGLSGIQLITSDDHPGLKAARRAVFAGIAWQRCHYHLQQNISSYVHPKVMMRQVAAYIRNVFNIPDRTTAETHLAFLVR